MIELTSLLLTFAAAYFLGWIVGTEKENLRCRRKLNMSVEEWEQLWNDEK